MNTRNYYTSPATHGNSMLAFPHTAQYGAAIEKPAPHNDRIVIATCIIAAVVLLCMGAAGWLPGGAV